VSEYKGQITIAVVVAIVGVIALAAAANFILPGQTTATVTTTATTAGQQQTSGQSTTQLQLQGLPPFANQNFDVEVNPAVASISSQGGTVDAVVSLTATNMTSSQELSLATHASIPGYSAKFNAAAVILGPGGSANVTLSVDVPASTPSGYYAISIVATGAGMQGGTWLLLTVGSGQGPPPP
jgi:uncharacterized membrane protein